MLNLDRLSDDLLRDVLRRLQPWKRATRWAIARVCRRFAALVRADTTLFVDLACDKWETDLAGLGRMHVLGDALVCPMSISVDVSTLPGFARRLNDALELALLAHRRTAAHASVRSLHLHRRHDLPALLPGLSFHIASVRSECIRDVTLTQCALPPNLGRLLAHVRHLQLFDCPLQMVPGQGEQLAGAALVAGLSSVPLESLLWVNERQTLPLELLETPRSTSPRTLVLGLDCLDLPSAEVLSPEDAAASGRQPSWWASLGVEIERMVGPDACTCACACNMSML